MPAAVMHHTFGQLGLRCASVHTSWDMTIRADLNSGFLFPKGESTRDLVMLWRYPWYGPLGNSRMSSVDVISGSVARKRYVSFDVQRGGTYDGPKATDSPVNWTIQHQRKELGAPNHVFMELMREIYADLGRNSPNSTPLGN